MVFGSDANSQKLTARSRPEPRLDGFTFAVLTGRQGFGDRALLRAHPRVLRLRQPPHATSVRSQSPCQERSHYGRNGCRHTECHSIVAAMKKHKFFQSVLRATHAEEPADALPQNAAIQIMRGELRCAPARTLRASARSSWSADVDARYALAHAVPLPGDDAIRCRLARRCCVDRDATGLSSLIVHPPVTPTHSWR